MLRRFINRELSWLGFARRVMALVGQDDLPLLERVKFAGIVGMLHDEFFMKRMSGLKREIDKSVKKLSIDGRTPGEEFAACREELLRQVDEMADMLQNELFPALARAGMPLRRYGDLDKKEKAFMRRYFERGVQPILTPLAVDSEHPFPFISNLGLNLALTIPSSGRDERFVRIKVPDNRPRWVSLPDGEGAVPLEQVIAANLDLLYPDTPTDAISLFRVTRGAEGRTEPSADINEDPMQPGSLVRQIGKELKARRFAGAVRLQVDGKMPKKRVKWLSRQLGVNADDVYRTKSLLGLADLQSLDAAQCEDLYFPPHDPVPHPRLAALPPDDTGAIFDEISRGDLLVHHPYHAFDSSVLRFLESAAADPQVLAIKLTIYRTSSDSPIVDALAEAARRGKQVAVLVEITARFDEAPNIEWGRRLEQEGVHVSYGVERLKTHVKLAMVVREETGGVRPYAHLGTGNYHTGTARIYEDVGLLTCEPTICRDVADVFNALTGVIPYPENGKLIVAPKSMRRRVTEMIRREAENARAGLPAGIQAKMNQLQDSQIIGELYEASRAGVPIELNVRGLCCLRPGVKGLSENIRVFSVVGRFLEHSRIFRFTNGGAPEFYFGSADWMKRNLDSRVETMLPVDDPALREELDGILSVYYEDNCSVWDCGSDAVYVRRTPASGEPRREAQAEFIRRARALPPKHRKPERDAHSPGKGRSGRPAGRGAGRGGRAGTAG